MKDFLKKTIFSEKNNITQNVLNLVLVLSALGGLVSAGISYFAFGLKESAGLVLILVLVASISLLISVKFCKPSIAAFLTVFTANVILYPTMFVQCGGVKSGVPVWFVLGLVMSVLVAKGRLCYLLFGMSLLSSTACLLTEYTMPEVIKPIHEEMVINDIIQAVVFSVCVIAIVYKYQVYCYEKKSRQLIEKEVQLEQAFLNLEDATVAKNALLTSMSHEIKNQVNAVLSMDEMILREGDNEDVLYYANSIKSAGNTLGAIVNDVLDFTRIESGKMVLKPVNYDLHPLLFECYQGVKKKTNEKNLELYYENNPSIPRGLYGDETRIKQILTNLLSNAVKYTHEGSVAFQMDYEQLGNEKICLVITVSDTGIGISKEKQSTLFDSYRSLESKKKEVVEGTGLGLIITKKLLELMEGTIEVFSDEGKGATFRVRIPQKIIDEKEVGNFQNRMQLGAKSYDTYRINYIAPKAKILVIDDVELNLEVMRRLLRNTKIQIDTAGSGMQGLAMTQTKMYDMIFIDYKMPGMDGVETLSELKRSMNNPNKETPLIMMTADAIVGAKKQSVDEGFSDYISKPVRGKILERIVWKYLPQELIEKPSEVVDEVESGYPTWLNVENGLAYCGGNEEFYREIINDFVQHNQMEKLKKFYEKKDWNNYEIAVHSLKSTAKTIGAEKFSEQAMEMEFAVKENKIYKIEAEHGKFLENYKNVLSRLAKI